MKQPSAKPNRREHREAAIQVLYSQAFVEVDLGRAVAGNAASRVAETSGEAVAALKRLGEAAYASAKTIESVVDALAELVKPPDQRQKVKVDGSAVSARLHAAEMRTAALKKLREATKQIAELDELFSSEGFAIRLLETYNSHQDRIDSALSRSLEGWSLRRLAAEDGAILRLGATELIHFDDVPPRVIINEYVELAKEFGGEDTPSLVNGVLDRILREHPRADKKGA